MPTTSKTSYRQYDVLIMDDVQFIAKPKRPRELFHLFNAMPRPTQADFVFSSDKHPAMLPGLEDRLKGRFFGRRRS